MSRRLVFVFLLALSACAQPVTAPRPSADIRSGDLPGAATIQPRTGAPSSLVAVPTVPASPKPSGGIGQPASYCKPGYCETPAPALTVYASSISGTATWYCRPGISRCTRGYPDGMYAAAGPELRKLLGPDWRGSEVIVTDALGNVAVVRIVDLCACGGDHVIDLYWLAFQGIVNPVTVREP